MANSRMDDFCGSEFWNLNVSWYTEDPDLTKCFEKTVLIWTPCLFLWLFSCLEVFYIVDSKYRDIPWNILNVSKLFVNGVLLVLTISDLGYAIKGTVDENVVVYNVDIYSPVIKLLTFSLAAVLLFYNRKHGQRTSGLQFLFWFLCALCGAAQFRTEIRESNTTDYYFISYIIYYVCVLLMFFLNWFADQAPRQSFYPKLEKPCPEESGGFLSRLMFSWFDRLAWLGFRKPLETTDLWDMKAEDSAKIVTAQFEKHWQHTKSKYEKSNASYKSDSARVDFVSGSKKKKSASILPALIKSFGPTFLFGAMLKLMQDILAFVSPQILKLLISFVENKEYSWRGFLYAGLLFGTAIVQTLILSQYFNRMFIVGMRIRTALVAAIYKKALRMSNSARKASTVGEIVNLMSVDAQKFVELTAYLNMIWSAPFQIILALYFLWQVLGPSVLAGLAVMIILIPVNGFIANRVKDLQIKQMKNKDERVKLMNEILSGIKVLKLYAWEPSFEAQVLKIRTKEMKVLKQAAYLNAGTSFIWSCAPFLVSLVSFATFVMVDEDNVLDASTAFVSLSLFNILRFPLSMLPMMISNMVQAGVSVKRINKFMNCEELDPESVSHDAGESDPLVIENGDFDWGEGPTLKNINLRLKKKSLTAVVGTVGSGKSSLISAFLGEMDKTSGRVNTVGSVAYVSQQAWIQNATLQDNVLFGKPLNKKLYDNIIEACALKADFDMLPAGDQTEIGEKGINLSGGQKQRISLARAVYANSDIYFLDDPLSAVDSHVGKHIFEKVLGPHGLLKHKTRVLVTHGITYLPQTDKIVVLMQGEVSEVGTYQELLDKKGAFAEFLIQHVNEAVEAEDDDGLDELQNQLGSIPVPEEISRKIQRARSHVSESISETGSEKTNGSLQRQKSSDSGGVRHRSSSSVEVQDAKKLVGEKLIEVEKAETGSVKWSVYKHYLMSIGLGLTVITLLLNMVFQGFSIGSNMWLSKWSTDEDMMLNGTGTINKDKRDLYLGVYGALGIGQGVSVLIASITHALGCIYATKYLHETLLNYVMRWPMAIFDTTPVGRVLNRFSTDVNVMDNVMPMLLSSLIKQFYAVIATLFVISYTTPKFAAVIVPIGIIYYFIQRFYVATSRQLKRLESVSRSPIYSHFGESVTGAVAIRAFGEEARFISESEAKVDFNQICYHPSIIANRWLAVRLEMVGNLIILFAALFVVLGRDEEQSAGLVGLSISYALQVTQTLNWLVRMTSDVETNIVAVERIKEYGETAQEAPWEIENKTPSSLWPETGSVEFKDYSVRYREGLDLVLKRVNFSVRGGEKVGIVGRTGAGKSSLTLSLFRIIEAAEGEIAIDGINISQLGLHALRSRLTIIPQDAVLFSGTLRMNLDPFDRHTDQEVWTALDQAHLKNFVKGLSAGLNHEVSEGGENLSVGQRQLICLSRALLRKTKVLVLDEATAAVDLETDDLIQRTIRTEFKDCTVLTIAHRLNTIMDSDRVIVLDKGTIVEFDSPPRLLQNRGSIFYSMCRDAGLA
ncbi:PREDICTED: multidrug resistance-associated protein 1 isoform X1 [Nicrophorus vespilloides]|uniref:ABC-type glutathione-S-conjugate transporter n=1 Tax=Nicrophorus vespilloides TaxID=110193 RepID=A0ABM1N667_NICVS|nr:PREDICTED: multidrug resistance-associated protein 1 isoform X1 [Nicrophorus vespilloides]XP_017782318.1 PREDICTED: multidrug resistance-associated protein 1 isoform X1 [Nicrophorus vespilloides]XP_017782319.1 PREDICTED: multidrug resistance-associated protein 1 isoform X1 [Nicrophorus vespilloides]XP_017782321.1 PREDICTED: multidrug resistance-associated protein 1 isoform X1 [Nicrophorus vespilloides]